MQKDSSEVKSGLLFEKRNSSEQFHLIPYASLVGLWDLPDNGNPRKDDLYKCFMKRFIYDDFYVGEGAIIDFLRNDDAFKGYAKAIEKGDFKIGLNWLERAAST